MSFSVWSVWLANGCHKSALVAGGQVVHDHVEIEESGAASPPGQNPYVGHDPAQTTILLRPESGRGLTGLQGLNYYCVFSPLCLFICTF